MQLKNDLWDFALSFYRAAEVESVCLELQEQHGLSINRLLLACWASLEGIALVSADFSGAASNWQQQVTHQVRRARYAARPNKDALADCYAKLRAAELACEQVELALLFNSVAQRKTTAYSEQLLRENIEVYLHCAEVSVDQALQERIKKLERAVMFFHQDNRQK